MKRTRSESRKFLIAKNTIKESITIVVASVIIAGMLFSPVLTNYIEKGLEMKKENVVYRGENITVYFQSENSLALTKVTTLNVSVAGGPANVYILKEEDFSNGIFNEKLAFNFAGIRLIDNTSVDYPISKYVKGFEKLVLFINVTLGDNVNIVCTINTKITKTINLYIPMVSVGIIIVSLISIIYFYFNKKRYADFSIYR